ncbi:methylamine utilization protein MauE [Opitutaceae bacterium TAV4]|nr:methylamine utilization protein MauE [Opitutaceae bacterium TAV4]
MAGAVNKQGRGGGGGVRWWSVLAARLLVGGLLLVAGVLKVADPTRFVTEIERYRLIGPQLSWAAGLYVPWAEIVTGAVLIFAPGAWRRAGAWCVTLGLYAAFAVFIGAAWWRGLDITCGCFGGLGAQSASPVNALTFARSLALLAVAAVGAYRECSNHDH